MQYKFFKIIMKNSESDENVLNAFIRSKRIISTRIEAVQDGSSSFWAVMVEYLESETGLNTNKKSIDYKEVLSEEDFALYVKLRDFRKKIAEDKGNPVYTIFSNEQLAEIAKRKVSTLKDMAKIAGIGEGKIEKYGTLFIGCIKEVVS